jgi:hypothetical protein
MIPHFKLRFSHSESETKRDRKQSLLTSIRMQEMREGQTNRFRFPYLKLKGVLFIVKE